MAIPRLGMIGVCAFVVLTSPARAQCRAPDAQSANMIGYLGSLVAAAAIDSELVATRQQYHLPAAKASQVTLVTNKKTCSRALATYRMLLPAGAPTSLYVVSVGNVYVVWIPATAGTEWAVAVVLDSRFIKLESFTT